jgi:hypothetical protein
MMQDFTIRLDDTDAREFHKAAADRLDTTDFAVVVGSESWDLKQCMAAGYREIGHPLSADEASRLGSLVDASRRHAKVARVPTTGGGDLLSDEPVYGTARALVRDPQNAYFLTGKDDVRNAYLWVTTTRGMEMFWPVAELVQDLAFSTFVIDYEPPKGA